jgi:hypothetical protein
MFFHKEQFSNYNIQKIYVNYIINFFNMRENVNKYLLKKPNEYYIISSG